MWLLLLLWLPSFSMAQNPCEKPDLSPPEQIKCANILNWSKIGSATPVAVGRAGAAGFAYGPPGVPGPPGAATPFPETIYDCMTIRCICSFISRARYSQGRCNMPDGSVYTRVQRKEYRMLTDSERSLYRQGFLAVRRTIYQELSTYHSNIVTSPAAHGGPAFLPWHREFLKRMEIGIRTTSVNGRYPFVNVAIPYWDSSMDADVKEILGISAKYSIMFTPELMGSATNGYLYDGQFGSFQGTKGWVRRVLDQWPTFLNMIKRADVDSIIYTQTLNQVLGATAGGAGCPTVPENSCERIHGDTHVWIGGDMQDTATSTNDPIFFLHHSFIDFIFEQWRLLRQTRAQRETQYNTAPNFCYGDQHRGDSAMTPFTNFINTDGLSNQYTDNMYTYALRPTCSSTRSCPSRFYFCNLNLNRCIARIQVNSVCKTIRGVDPCYRSVCSVRTGANGRCIAPPAMPGVGSAPTPEEPAPVPDTRVVEMCYNRQPCCAFIANPTTCADVNTKAQCPASCNQCKPQTYALTDDCANRHNLCTVFKNQGLCESQMQFMAENCRKECGFCGTSRSQGCQNAQGPTPPGTGVPPYPAVGGGSGKPPAPAQGPRPGKPGVPAFGPTPEKPGVPPYGPSETGDIGAPGIHIVIGSAGPRPGKPGVPGSTIPEEGNNAYPTPPPYNEWCYNNDRCCSYWAKTQGCNKNSEMMQKVCAASCTCSPIFDLTKCSNFIKQCPIYASRGLCWLEFIKENCRRSCNSCLSPSEVGKQCARY